MLTHQIPFRVYMADTDASSWIHFAAVMRYFEEAEFTMLKTIGLTYHSMDKLGFQMPRRHLTSEYHLPLQIDDEGIVDVKVAEVGNSSVRFAFKLTLHGLDKPHVEGQYTGVCVDMKSGMPIRVPDDVRAALCGEIPFVERVNDK